MNFLQSFLANKHTSGSAIVYLVASVAGHIANVWFPQHSKEIDQTVGVIKEGCFGWGMIMAGDASQVRSLKAEVRETQAAVITGDTTIIEQPKK